MTTWAYAGTALTTYGRVTVVNDYLDIPERRGENQALPFRHGRRHVEKYYDERKITIGIAINTASATVLESTIDALKKQLGVRAQQTLAQTMEDSSVRNASAAVDKPIEIDRLNDRFAKAVIEFTLADPIFRGTSQINNAGTASAGTVTFNVVNSGNVEERDPVLHLIGPLNNPSWSNGANSHTLAYAGSIAAGGTVVIQTASTGEYTATNGTTNVIGNITHSPSSALMVFNPGTNTITLVNTGGTTGVARALFYPPYI
jgi:hypothetical protein